jgi:CBS domain-containing protein
MIGTASREARDARRCGRTRDECAAGGEAMTVSLILANKGRVVVTVGPDETLASITKLLTERGIGAVVVTAGDGAIAGILSERDIVRAVAKAGGGCLGDSASAHMTHKVETVTPTATVNEVMERMTHGKFRHVPVVEQGKLAGILSIGDVVKHRLAEIEADASAMRDYIATA